MIKTIVKKIKAILSKSLNKYLLGVDIYDLNDNLNIEFKNNTELSKQLNISKVIAGKDLNKDLIYKEICIWI